MIATARAEDYSALDQPGLNIAMLTTFYPPYNFGGDGIGVKRLATALADRGHRVTVVHNRDAYRLLADNEPAPTASDPRIEVIGLEVRHPMLANLVSHQTGHPVAQKAALTQLFASKQFDVIWYHNISLMGGSKSTGVCHKMRVSGWDATGAIASCCAAWP